MASRLTSCANRPAWGLVAWSTPWLHSARSGCTVQLCWHARDGLWGELGELGGWGVDTVFMLTLIVGVLLFTF